MEKLAEIFREVFQDDEIELVGDLVIKDLENWDSFNNINLMIAVEDVFQVVITPDEIESIQTVHDLLEILRKKGCDVV